MKKPSVSKSKKGAIFNILWLLIENPTGLEYFRVLDVKNQLLEEFGINLDRKTIHDYLDILIELNLPFEISHENNKGYYVSKRMISDTERHILIQALDEQKAIDLESKIKMFNYLTFDCSKENKTHYYHKPNTLTHVGSEDYFNLVENLEIIQKAIDEKRSITFEYMNYNKYGELMHDARRYEVIPQKIEYIYGMYYLYNADKFWANIYCGTKIKYMRNIKIGDVHHNPPLHEKYNFSFEVEVIYEWSIELIVDYFDDYKLIRDQNKIRAIINTPYEFALDWCKKYVHFFVINSDELKEAILKDMDSLVNDFNNKDRLILKIKSAIVDYHYRNPINEKSSYQSYMKGLYKFIDFDLYNMGYQLEPSGQIKCYSNMDDTLYISFLECSKRNVDFNNETLTQYIINAYMELKKLDHCKKILVVFYDDISEEDKTKIKKSLGFDLFLNIHDKFSNCNEAYFHQYLVIEVH